LLLGVLATTGLALLITGAVVAYHDLRSFRDSLVTDITALADILGLAATPALVFDDPFSATEYLALLRAKPAVRAAAIYATNGALLANYATSEEPFPRLPEPDGYRISGDEMVLFK